MLDLVKQSGCRIFPGSIEQLLFYNRTDVNFKTLSQFEPSKAFADEEKLAPMTRVGEYPSFDSEEREEFAQNQDAVPKPDKSREQHVIEEEFQQLAKRSYVVRRGRNNQLLVRPILEMIFDEGPNSYELSYGLPGQNLLENRNYMEKRIFSVGTNYYQQ